MDTSQLISLSNERLSELRENYDPITGEGSFLDRFPIKLTTQGKTIYLPKALCKEYAIKDSLQENCNEKDFEKEVDKLIAMRLVTDFEFWAVQCAFITDKLSSEIIPFKLNRPQRKVLVKLEQMRLDGVPIRLIILKARQWGGSTLIQIYIAWIQLMHKKNWHSTIVSHVDSSAINVRGMYSRLLRRYPLEPLNYGPYEGGKFKIIKERGCIHSIGSYESPDSLRSNDIRCSHLTEIGIWKKTSTKSPEDIIATISSAIPNIPYTIMVMESTAKGIGNYFHRSWIKHEQNHQDAIKGVFVAWYENPFNLIDFKSNDERKRLIESLSEYEESMLDMGATLEGINWYRFELATYGGDESRMHQEAPCTPEEAFQSTGRPAFKRQYIKNLESSIKNPIFKGEIESDAQTGPDAFKNIELVDKEKGRLKIWSKPNDPPVDEGWIFKGTRYVVTLDIGGVSKGSDYSSVSVLDRYWLAAAPGDGKVEKVAQWHGHLDPDLMAWLSGIIATFYEDGVLVIENNTYDSRYQKTDGEHSYTVLDEIGGFYKNLYSATPLDLIKSGVPKKYGFRTDINTKPMIVNFYRQMLRDKGFVERNIEALQEAKNYEITEQGKFSAVPGNHDDILMSDMIGLWVACSDKSPLGIPTLEKEEVVRKRLDRKNVVSHASF